MCHMRRENNWLTIFNYMTSFHKKIIICSSKRSCKKKKKRVKGVVFIQFKLAKLEQVNLVKYKSYPTKVRDSVSLIFSLHGGHIVGVAYLFV